MPNFPQISAFCSMKCHSWSVLPLRPKRGFRAVEYMAPYPYAASELKAALEINGLTQGLFNLPAGNLDEGERGMACIPGREAEFRSGVATAIDYAHALGCRKVNCLAASCRRAYRARTRR